MDNESTKNEYLPLLPGWIAALLATPVAAGLGGLLSAVIVVLASLPFEAPSASWRPELVTKGIFVGVHTLMWLLPAIVIALHVVAARFAPTRYGTIVGWGAFVAGGALPYLVYPGYSDFLIGLVAGMGASWAFSKAVPFDLKAA